MAAPGNQTALQKRLKRHVIGRKQRFFAATVPGLESICRDELNAILPAESTPSIADGGVEFKGRLHDCYRVNLNLRSANRVLMRIGSFHAANFRQLEKNLVRIPWELYFLPATMRRIRVTSRHSRLYHKDAVADRVLASIAFRFTQMAEPEKTDPNLTDTQHIFVRVSDNHFTFSIDSSGDLLHKRGLKPHSAKAPLRETIAAAALILAGYTGTEPLLDPMCGSGSFSLEAALMAQHIPPGWFREFAFMKWPSFQPGRWKHIKREAEKKITPVNSPLIFASDQDALAVTVLASAVDRKELSGIIAVSNRNFFDLSPHDLTQRRGLVALNPPFGYRLGSQRESSALFSAVGERLKKLYRGWKLALVLPNPSLAEKIPFRLARHLLPHGGLKIVLLTGTIP